MGHGARARRGMSRITFRDGQEVRVMGREFRISASEGSARSSSGRLDGKEIRITLAAGLPPRQRERHVSSLSRRMISASLLPSVTERVRELNRAHFRFPLGTVSLKDNLSNWGSCSVKRNVNLNFRLLFAPPEVLDYVIIHELSHLRERNHSPAFWSLVEKAVPGYMERIKWLKENGSRLGTGSACASSPAPLPRSPVSSRA